LDFLEETYYHVAGHAFMTVAVFVLLVGIIRFLQMHSELKHLRLTAARLHGGEASGQQASLRIWPLFLHSLSSWTSREVPMPYYPGLFMTLVGWVEQTLPLLVGRRSQSV
jgi:hypothetical protein